MFKVLCNRLKTDNQNTSLLDDKFAMLPDFNVCPTSRRLQHVSRTSREDDNVVSVTKWSCLPTLSWHLQETPIKQSIYISFIL